MAWLRLGEMNRPIELGGRLEWLDWIADQPVNSSTANEAQAMAVVHPYVGLVLLGRWIHSKESNLFS
jgi:hypothetical protein